MSLTLSEILFEINRATLGDQQRFNNLVFTPKRHCYHEKRIEKKPSRTSCTYRSQNWYYLPVLFMRSRVEMDL